MSAGQLSMKLGLRKRDAALGAIQADTPSATWQAVERAILSYAGHYFTADAVRDRLPYQARIDVTSRPNILGSVFKTLASRGQIAPTELWVRSQREGARGRRLTCWRVVER